MTVTFTANNGGSNEDVAAATHYNANRPALQAGKTTATLADWFTQFGGARFFGNNGNNFYQNVLSKFKNNATLQKVANGGTISQADFTQALKDAGLGQFFVAHGDDANTSFNPATLSTNVVDTIAFNYANNRNSAITLSAANNANPIDLNFTIATNGGNGWVASNGSNGFHGDYGQNNWTAPGSTPAQRNQ